MKRMPRRWSIAARPEELETRQLLSTLVAIVDSGVDLNDSYSNPYYNLTLAKNMATGATGALAVQDVSLNGGPGHGAAVTRLAVQGIREIQDQPGASGADVEILPVKIRDANGLTSPYLIGSGIRYAADQGAASINVSLVYQFPYFDITSAIQYAQSLGSIVVTAAANFDGNIDDPVNPIQYFPTKNDDPVLVPSSPPITNLIVAAAVLPSGDLTPQSNWGPVHVDVGAPTNSEGYTSYAAGYTSGFIGGVASLMPSSHTYTQVLNLVKGTVTPHAQAVGSWSTTGGNLSPANAVQALNLTPPNPTATSLGQDGHDYIGEGSGSTGPDGYQDIHFSLSNLAAGKSIDWIRILGGGGEWRYNNYNGSYKAVLTNYTAGSATADLYVPPFQNESGSSYSIEVHYTDSTTGNSIASGVYATYQLPVAPVVFSAISLGQDGFDAIGPGSGSTGPDGYQDIHFSLNGLAPSKTIDWIRILGNGGGEWRYNNYNGSFKAVLTNYSVGATTADLYIPTYQNETGRAFSVAIQYTDSTAVTATTNGVYATHNLPMTASGPSATSLGQDGRDYIGEGPSSSGPDGYQDIHIVLSGLPANKSIAWIGIVGDGGGEWRYNGPSGTYKAALVDYTAGDKLTNLYIPTYQNETGRSFFLTIHFTDSTSVSVTAYGVYATHHLPA